MKSMLLIFWFIIKRVISNSIDLLDAMTYEQSYVCVNVHNTDRPLRKL